jgi:hypothetical protein
VAPVLGPQRENFGAPEQLTGKQQNPKGDKTGPRSGSGNCGPWRGSRQRPGSAGPHGLPGIDVEPVQNRNLYVADQPGPGRLRESSAHAALRPGWAPARPRASLQGSARAAPRVCKGWAAGGAATPPCAALGTAVPGGAPASGQGERSAGPPHPSPPDREPQTSPQGIRTGPVSG